MAPIPPGTTYKNVTITDSLISPAKIITVFANPSRGTLFALSWKV
jgi:hypothetical protein